MKRIALLLALAACGKSAAGQSQKTAAQPVGDTGWKMEVPTDCKLASEKDGFAVTCGKTRLATLTIWGTQDADPSCGHTPSPFGEPGAKPEADGLLWNLCEQVSETEPMRHYVAATMPLADGKALRCDSETVVSDAAVRGAVCYKMHK